MTERRLSVSILHTAHTSEASRASLSVAELISALGEYQARAEKDGGAWSSIVWRDDERAIENAQSVSCLVYDLDWDTRADHDSAMGALGARLEALGWVYAIHETFTARRWRLVIPLARDLSPGEYRGAWEGAIVTLGLSHVDATGKDLARLFYLPSHPPGETRESGSGGTELYNPPLSGTIPYTNATPQNHEGQVKDRYEPPTPRNHRESVTVTNQVGGNSPGENRSQKFSDLKLAASDFSKQLSINLEKLRLQLSKSARSETRRDLLAMLDHSLVLAQGERENQLHLLISSYVPWVDPEFRTWDVVDALFRPVIERMQNVNDHGVDYYLGKVHSSWERALERAEKEEAATEAAKNYFQLASEDWRRELIRFKDTEEKVGAYKNLSSNLDIILQHHPDFRGHIHFNELSRRLDVRGGVLGPFEGSYDVGILQWLERSEFEMELDKGKCGAALIHHARKHRFNPVQDYLESLLWDGKPRLSDVLRKYCGATGRDSYIDDISRKFFISAVARALEPGCQVDTVLVLQGLQGVKKTTFVRAISKGWYTSLSGQVDNKDTRIQSTESWIVEMSELAMLTRGELNKLRGFITDRKDNIRIPYATYHEDFQRRCVFVGTTNSNQPLVDEEGNRRWWVVSCGRIDIPGLEADVDQIWAEAVACFKAHCAEVKRGVAEQEMGYRWWFTPQEQLISDEENELFQMENPISMELIAWADQNHGKDMAPMTALDIAKKILRISNETLHRDKEGVLVRIGQACKRAEWKRIRMGAGRNRYYAYLPPGSGTVMVSGPSTRSANEYERLAQTATQ
jgi:predicted P-loop ATPase